MSDPMDNRDPVRAAFEKWHAQEYPHSSLECADEALYGPGAYCKDAVRNRFIGWAAARAAISTPNGWKLVPIEPTNEMVQAAFDAVELNGFPGFATGNEARRAIYKAMLAAADPPKEPPPIKDPT
jgi:hypothetical protein